MLGLGKVNARQRAGDGKRDVPMICNRCGAENDDGLRFCLACGHKLRSRERGEPESGGEDAAAGDAGAGSSGEGRDGEGRTPGAGASLEKRMFLSALGGGRTPMWRGLALAWILALVLGGAAVWLIAAGVYWPLYPLTGLAALLAWRRKL